MCYFAFSFSALSGLPAHKSPTNRLFLPTLVESSTHHQNRRNHHMMEEENRNQKSRSMYEYEIIIILSTLHNPSEFSSFLCAAFIADSVCASKKLFPGASFLRWWLQTIPNPPFVGSLARLISSKVNGLTASNAKRSFRKQLFLTIRRTQKLRNYPICMRSRDCSNGYFVSTSEIMR